MNRLNPREITKSAVRSKSLAAAAALGSAGRSDSTEMARIMTLLQKSDPAIRCNAIKALQGIRGPQAVTLISRALDDKVAVVRKTACQALGRLRAHSAKLAIIDCLYDKDPSVCCGAADALFQMGDKSGVEIIKKLLYVKGEHQLEALAIYNHINSTSYALNDKGLQQVQKNIGHKRNWLFRY